MQVRGVDQRVAGRQVYRITLQSDPVRPKALFRAIEDQRVAHLLHPDKQPDSPNLPLQALVDALKPARLRDVQLERIHQDPAAKPIQTCRQADPSA